MRGPAAILLLLGIGALFLFGRQRTQEFTSRGTVARPQPITSTRPTVPSAPPSGTTARPRPIAGLIPSPPMPISPSVEPPDDLIIDITRTPSGTRRTAGTGISRTSRTTRPAPGGQLIFGAQDQVVGLITAEGVQQRARLAGAIMDSGVGGSLSSLSRLELETRARLEREFLDGK